MAQCAAGQAHVIPMSRWLADRDAAAAFAPPQEADAMDAIAVQQAALALAYERGCSVAAAEAEARFDALRGKDNEAASRREDELAAMWALRCSETVAAEIHTAFAQLQSALENRLHDILLPFLAEAVRQRSVQELLRLTRHEMSRLDEPPLEIRAPAAVLGPLQDELVRLGITAVLAEDGTVTVRTGGQAAVFESMASRWIEAISNE